MTAVGLVITSLLVTDSPAQAEQADEKPTYKVIPYVIAEPNLVKHPDKIAAELQRAGNLDKLGVKPATGDKPSEIIGRKRAAAAPASYVVDSGRFPGGRKPDDPYQYIDATECSANADLAS